MEIKQEFKPAFRIYTDGKEWEVKSRTWECLYSDDRKLTGINHKYWTMVAGDKKAQTKATVLEMGACQIEEIWKYYKNSIWISNYGYVANISGDEAEEVFGKNNIEEFKHGFSFRTCNLDGEDGLYKVKNLFRLRNFVPVDNSGCGMEINLHVTQVGEDLYKMVAKSFLMKPDDVDKYTVHHIDNNSYNNNVTNLIYIRQNIHCESSGVLHPMSLHFSNYKYQTFDSEGSRRPLQDIKNRQECLRE